MAQVGLDGAVLTEPIRRPSRQKITDAELSAWKEEGLTYTEMQRRLEQLGRPILTTAGLSYRWKQIEAKRGEDSRILPWTIAVEHSQNFYMYSAVLAYGKMRKGLGLSDKDRRLAREFEQQMQEAGTVLYYNRDEGFVLRRRRPDDGPSMLVSN